MIDLYIYYQVGETDAPALHARVLELQARLAAAHGVACQLKRRPDVCDGLQTWMEIYTGAGPGFDAALDAAVRDAGLATLTAGARHTEVFMDLLTCA